MEYMILVGVLLVVLIPLFNYVSYYSAQHVKVEKLEDAVQTLGKTADTLYALGPGNRDYVWISLPGGVKETSVLGNEILITVSSSGGESDFHYNTIGEVRGTIPTEKGDFKMKVEVIEEAGEIIYVYIEKS